MKLRDLLRESQFNSLTDAQAATLINQKNAVKLGDKESMHTWSTLSLLFPNLVPVTKGKILQKIDEAKLANDYATVGFLDDIMNQLSTGVYFNNDLVLAGIENLRLLGIITQTESDNLKALGVVQKSLADIHELGTVTSTQVANARTHNVTIDWWVGRQDLVLDQLNAGTITTKTQVRNIVNQ